MKTLESNASKEERLPVLVSGVGGVTLIGVPTLPHKSSEATGSLISTASVRLLEEWDCKDCSICFITRKIEKTTSLVCLSAS